MHRRLLALTIVSAVACAPESQDATPKPRPAASTWDACSFPALRPDSLPWLAQGESVPNPGVVGEYKRLNWFGPDGTDWAGSYVSMRLLMDAPDVDGIAAPPLPDGTSGVLLEHDTAWDVYWQESTRYCGAIALEVYLRPLSPDEVRSEAIELARSLREEPSVSPGSPTSG
jgi:hypothetical protein